MTCPRCGGQDSGALPSLTRGGLEMRDGKPVRVEAPSTVGFRCGCGPRILPKPWSIWRKVRFALAWPLYRLAMRISEDVWEE